MADLARVAPIPPEHGRLLYDEAIRRLAAQDTDLTNIRSRAGTLIAGISIVTTFLAGATITQSGIERPLAWIALALFTASLGMALYVMVSPVQLQSGFSPRQIKAYIEQYAPESGYLAAHLAVQLEEAIEANRPLLKHLRRAILISVLLLFLEVLAWILLLGLE